MLCVDVKPGTMQKSHPMANNRDNHTANSSAFGGFIMGLLIGGVFALFRGPRFPWSKFQDIQINLDQVVNRDPLATGIAEGKATARRHHGEPGKNSPD